MDSKRTRASKSGQPQSPSRPFWIGEKTVAKDHHYYGEATYPIEQVPVLTGTWGDTPFLRCAPEWSGSDTSIGLLAANPLLALDFRRHLPRWHLNCALSRMLF